MLIDKDPAVPLCVTELHGVGMLKHSLKVSISGN
jgi:hypothetical protein